MVRKDIDEQIEESKHVVENQVVEVEITLTLINQKLNYVLGALEQIQKKLG